MCFKIYLCVFNYIYVFKSIFVCFEIYLCVLKYICVFYNVFMCLKYISVLHLWATVQDPSK